MKVDDDASHAFYLGIELARAQIAFQLGKDYDQDNELNWGIAVKKKKQNLLKRPDLKITQKYLNVSQFALVLICPNVSNVLTVDCIFEVFDLKQVICRLQFTKSFYSTL